MLLAAACAGGPVVASDDGPVPPTEPTPLPTATAPTDDPSPNTVDPAAPVDPDDPEAGGRLAVQTASDTLFTVLPDGSDPQPLGDDNQANTRPTWSPDAGFVAWASVDSATGASALAASRFDGTASHRAASAGTVAAIGWDPASTAVAYLAGVPTGRQLSVVGIAEPSPETALDTGSPYWFTWAPADAELLVHADGFRLDRIDLDGTTVAISTDTGDFQTPVWIDAERALLFADGDSATDTSSLVSTGAEGEGRLSLLGYEGYLRLIANPDGNRVAVQVSESPPDVAEIITASFGQIDPSPRVTLGLDQLFVVAVFGGSPASIDRLPAEAFAWSADGVTLAYLVRVTAGEDPWYEWRFQTPFGTSIGPLHQLTDAFRDEYLPYFDQLADDVTFFSPDGTRFVFTGRTLDGTDGVWIHAIGSDAPPSRIADGVFATWSPGPAGGQARNIL